MAMKPDAPDAAMIRFTITNNGMANNGMANNRLADEIHETGNDMTVKAGSPWKRLPASKNQRRWDDMWTWNGPQIDRITVVRGLPDGEAIVTQKTNADQQVPVFRADMTTQDLASMVEVSYRVNGVTVFNMESVEPFDFLGGPGVRLRYNYVSGIAFSKRGSCVMRIVGGKLYAMKLDSLAGSSFDTVAPEFDRLIASAQLRK
jgi:hypothetical protein